MIEKQFKFSESLEPKVDKKSWKMLSKNFRKVRSLLKSIKCWLNWLITQSEAGQRFWLTKRMMSLTLQKIKSIFLKSKNWLRRFLKPGRRKCALSWGLPSRLVLLNLINLMALKMTFSQLSVFSSAKLLSILSVLLFSWPCVLEVHITSIFVNPLHVVQQSCGKCRLILNLLHLNKFVWKQLVFTLWGYDDCVWFLSIRVLFFHF